MCNSMDSVSPTLFQWRFAILTNHGLAGVLRDPDGHKRLSPVLEVYQGGLLL